MSELENNSSNESKSNSEDNGCMPLLLSILGITSFASLMWWMSPIFLIIAIVGGTVALKNKVATATTNAALIIGVIGLIFWITFHFGPSGYLYVH
jgi:hypothetical protein